MWDFLTKVVTHFLNKVSFITMFTFLLIAVLVWFALPFDMLSYYVAPRQLPVGIYWAVLFVVSAGLFLIVTGLDAYFTPRFKRWKAFKHWESIYVTLSHKELETIDKLVSQDKAPLELTRQEAKNLVVKGIIQVKFFHPMFNSYVLTPSFRAFIFHKYQKVLMNKPD